MRRVGAAVRRGVQWVARHAGRIVADSAEGYASRRNLYRVLNDLPMHVGAAAESGSVEVAR